MVQRVKPLLEKIASHIRVLGPVLATLLPILLLDKTFANYSSGTGLISRIYVELKKLISNNKKKKESS